MKIKGVREPNKKEKSKIIPMIILFGTTTILVTGLLYMTYFNKEIGESMYKENNWLMLKSIATHNFMIKIFEIIYGRDYMLSKLEGLSVASLLSAVFNICCYGGLALNKKIDDWGLKR